MTQCRCSTKKNTCTLKKNTYLSRQRNAKRKRMNSLEEEEEEKQREEEEEEQELYCKAKKSMPKKMSGKNQDKLAIVVLKV